MYTSEGLRWFRAAQKSEAEMSKLRAESAVERDVVKRRDFSNGIPDMSATAYLKMADDLRGKTDEEIDDMIREAEYDEAEPGSPLRVHADGLKYEEELKAARKHEGRVTLTARQIMQGRHEMTVHDLKKSADTGHALAGEVLQKCFDLWDSGEPAMNPSLGRMITKSQYEMLTTIQTALGTRSARAK